MEKLGEGAYFKVDPNMQRPPEDSCIKKKLLDGAKLPLRGMKSVSGQVRAAPVKPLTAAAQQLFGDRQRGSVPAARRPPKGPASPRQGVSGMRYFEQRVPCQALLDGVPGKGPGAVHGFGIPQRARSEAAGGWVVGWGSGTRC